MRDLLSKEKWQYVFYTMSHPMDGFYWIRHAEKGSVPIAIFLVMLFSISFTVNRLLASFVVNDLDPRGVDSLNELFGILIFFLLICVSNWSITCLMNGEGRMKDISIAIGYSTLPITSVLFVATILSQVVADDEQAFYTLLLVNHQNQYLYQSPLNYPKALKHLLSFVHTLLSTPFHNPTYNI